MPRVTIYIRKDNWRKWISFKNRSAFVNKAIEKFYEKVD